MNSVGRAIFRAIHEGLWLRIEYKNKAETVTKYWGGILDMDPVRGRLRLDGLHLTEYTITELDIYIASIQNAAVIEGTYCPVNERLVRNIEENPETYRPFFGSIGDLRILNYLEMCYRMDSTPYHSDFTLVKALDNAKMQKGVFNLSQEQFETLIRFLQSHNKQQEKRIKKTVRRLAMNILSVHTGKGLYVLAYRELQFDIKNRCLHPNSGITICQEFQLDFTYKESVRRFLDADDYELLYDFDKNAEQIKDCISKHNPKDIVDDIPYIMGIGRDIIIDLHSEYQAIEDMMNEGRASVPVKAFFGELLDKPRRSKVYPIALINQKVNLDQLLAIHNAIKNPTTYIQGPPGTGKTNTIINTIITAFFNERTVLFSSYNNHPLDDVAGKIASLQYNGRKIPFPFLRIGNAEKVVESVKRIKELILKSEGIKVFSDTLDKRKEDRIERAKKLSVLLRGYENLLDLKEREETLIRLLDYQEKNPGDASTLPFAIDLNNQLNLVQAEIRKKDIYTEEEALKLLDKNQEEFLQYLFFTSVRYLKRLQEDRYSDFRNILNLTEENDQVEAFNKYIQDPEKLKSLLCVFPVIISTCLSAHRLGDPEPIFDMTIMDEASQCNTAVSLVPVLRGYNLMLVGDPQQLNPVILLDEMTNKQLRSFYHVSDEYDYRNNSVYKTFLACDSVSDEILLHNHYRCHRKIIGFNNAKYYHSQLVIKTTDNSKNPLILADIPSEKSNLKNSSEEEAEKVVQYVKNHQNESIGIITPFVNQKNLIEERLRQEKLENVSCGTVHSFQGDEKDIILFSTAIGKGTGQNTYNWLRNNKELINVATSRARKQLILLSDVGSVEKLHNEKDDDFYELVQYIRENGEYFVTPKDSQSRALGVKPFSTETEEAFLQNLNHALSNIWLSESRHSIKKEVPISQVFENNTSYDKLFYTGRFDFVVYEKRGNAEYPVLAIELDGKEHFEDAVVKNRDARKEAICRDHQLQLIRVENVYARRYEFIKRILFDYFKRRH